MSKIKRHDKILAFQSSGSHSTLPTYFAFHMENMELAKISEETWSLLPEAENTYSDYTLKTATPMMELVDWNNSVNEKVTNSNNQFGIKSLTINVTQICNFKCSYCAAGGDGTYGDPVTRISIEKTLPQIKFFMEQRKAGENFHLSFLGGEPLLYPEAILAISRYARALASEKNLKLSLKLTTNGSLFTDANILLLNEQSIEVVVSLDGPAQINDQFRQQKNAQGTAELVIAGIKKLSQNRKGIPSIAVHAVFSEKNTEVLRAYDFFAQLPIDWMEFNFNVSANDPELAQSSSESFMAQLKLVVQKAYARGGETELRRIGNFDHYFQLLDSQERKLNHCGLGKSFLMLDARNQIFNCPWTVGNKADQLGSGTNLNTDHLNTYSQNIIERNNCQTCWAKYLCGGGCSFVHGTTATELNKDSLAQKKQDYCYRAKGAALLALDYFAQSRIESTLGQNQGDTCEMGL